ncbi:MAG: TPM domain-containing protein [Pseudomonadota bacterium]
MEDYANRLFRYWKLGQAKKNNGVLLLVAPTERKVRIEVGYGLEGILTDAVASTIIRNAIIPSFKAGDMAGGLVKGTDAILEILNLDPEDARQRAKALEGAQAGGEADWVFILVLVIMVIIFILIIRHGGGGGGRTRRRGGMVYFPGGGGGWSGSSSGGGFSGGGGSSGGGGASGGW